MSSDGGVRRPSGGRTFLTLLLGVALGAIAAVAAVTLDLVPLDLLDAGDGEAGEAEPSDGSASPSPDGIPAASGSGDVPPPCLAAAEHNATVSAALDDVAVGVRDQDALAVEQGLDAISDIKPDMDAASQECRTLAGAGDAGDAGDDE